MLVGVGQGLFQSPTTRALMTAKAVVSVGVEIGSWYPGIALGQLVAETFPRANEELFYGIHFLTMPLFASAVSCALGFLLER